MLEDGYFNRTYAAAVRKAIFSHAPNKGVLVVHVGAGVGTLSIAAASARPDSADHVVACERSADLISVAEQCARHNHLGSSRISFLQKDARNLVPHDELSRKADIVLLECIDHTIGAGILHYCEHLNNGFAAPNCRLIPAAGVMKGCSSRCARASATAST